MMMSNGNKVDPFEGWIDGYRYNTLGEVANADSVITCPYPVNAGDNIIVFTAYYNINEYSWAFNSQTNAKVLLGPNNRPMTFTIPDGYDQIRTSLAKEGLDSSYIFNQTTGRYLYKGKNV